MVSVRDYSVFGLKVRSAIPLPELRPDESVREPDVTIAFGPVPAAPGDSNFGLHMRDGALVLVVPDVARYAIREGASITIEPEVDTPEKNIRLFLLGSAFGALLHQRGLLPLHANAIEFDGKAVAFMGASGHGKSTLAAWFHDRGHRIVADDVCVVRFDDRGQPHASPGLPRLRLWLEALEMTGRKASRHARSYAGADSLEKYDVSVPPESSARSEMALGAVYLLDQGDEFAIERLEGIAAAEAVFANTYRGAYIGVANGQLSHWEACVTLVQTAPIYRLKRVWGFAQLDSDCARVTAHIQSELAPVGS